MIVRRSCEKTLALSAHNLRIHFYYLHVFTGPITTEDYIGLASDAASTAALDSYDRARTVLQAKQNTNPAGVLIQFIDKPQSIEDYPGDFEIFAQSAGILAIFVLAYEN